MQYSEKIEQLYMLNEYHIMPREFHIVKHELLELIDEVKEKLSDLEYKNLMDKMAEMNRSTGQSSGYSPIPMDWDIRRIQNIITSLRQELDYKTSMEATFHRQIAHLEVIRDDLRSQLKDEKEKRIPLDSLSGHYQILKNREDQIVYKEKYWLQKDADLTKREEELHKLHGIKKKVKYF